MSSRQSTTLHRQAMDMAAQAMMNPKKRRRRFRQALKLELAAIKSLPEQVEPTTSVLFRSAAQLALDCNLYTEAIRLATTPLVTGKAPPEIAAELQAILTEANKAIEDHRRRDT